MKKIPKKNSQKKSAAARHEGLITEAVEAEKGGKTGRRLGYARVSSKDQDNEMQVLELRKAGCAEVWADTISAVKRKIEDRPEFTKLRAALQPGDTLVVYRLDRLARCPKEGLTTIDKLLEDGVRVESVKEQFELYGPTGRFFCTMLLAGAAWERENIRQRCEDGRNDARRQGKRLGGRNPAFDDKKRRAAAALLADENVKVGEAAKQLKVGASTLFREVAKFTADALEADRPARELFVEAWGRQPIAAAPLLDFLESKIPA